MTVTASFSGSRKVKVQENSSPTSIKYASSGRGSKYGSSFEVFDATSVTVRIKSVTAFGPFP